LKDQSSGLSSGGSQSQVRRLLVAAQIGLSLLLLIAAGLFTRTLSNLLNQNLGFNPDRLVTFSVDPSLNGYSRERRLAFVRELRQRLSSLPGATIVASAEFTPFGNSGWGNGVKAPGTATAAEKYVDVHENSVSPSYFRALGIPILAGRDFRDSDTATSPKVVILNRTLARYLFGDKNPIGRRLILGADQSDVEVAGIVADSQYSGVRDAPGRFLYAPYEQCDDEFTRQASFFVRTGGLESSVLSGVTATVRQLDANIPVRRLETMNALVLDSIYTERLLAILVAAFGVLAATLAAVGLFGTLSYAVTRRTREFGIRIALGAGGSSILGVAAGLPASYALARLVESQLFGIRAHDPVVLIGATLLMAVVALAAGLIPGTRAMRIEPVRALKHE
jgi:predicted permease